MKKLNGAELIAAARDLSQKAHSGQIDKAGAAYYLHPQTVASYVDSTEEKVVAFLHDVVEDTDITLEAIAAMGFDKNIIEAIDAITKRKGEEYDTYLARVIENPIALKVKLADMQHNSDISRFKNQDEYAKKITDKYKLKIQQLRRLSASRT